MIVESSNNELTVIERELLANGLRSVADDMAVALARSSRSNVVRDHLDFSTAVLDRDGALIAQGTCLALQLGAMPFAMRAIIDHFGDDIAENDVFLTNDPFNGGGTHLPDLIVAAPFFADGECCGFVAILAHMVDIGGAHAGGLSTESSEIYADGFRIPPVKYMDAGVRSEIIDRLLSANVRMSDKVIGDLRGMVAALKIGESRMADTIAEFGQQRLLSGFDSILDYSEKAAKARVLALPDGQASFTDFIDDIVVAGESLALTVRLEVKGDQFIVDYTDMPEQVAAGLNATLCNSYSFALFALRALVDEDIPVNDGFARALKVESVRGTITHAEYPASVAGRGATLYRVWDALLGALCQLIPDRAMAAGSGGYDVLVFSGNRADGSSFIIPELLGGGWGARAGIDGIDGISHPVINQSNTPIETLEAEYPLIVTDYTYVSGTGGDGEFRGGSATRRGYIAQRNGVLLSYRGTRTRHRPWGFDGGGDGTLAETIVTRADGSQTTLVEPTKVVLNEGDRVVHTTAGSGGVGDASRRTDDNRRSDLQSGLLPRGAEAVSS